jgi:hypothetical protein
MLRTALRARGRVHGGEHVPSVNLQTPQGLRASVT